MLGVVYIIPLILLSAFITVTLFSFPGLKHLVGKQNSIFRLKKYVGPEALAEGKQKPARREYRTGLNIVAKTIGSAKMLDGYKRKVQFQLTRAHLLLKAEEYITVCLTISVVFALLGLMSTRNAGFGFTLIYTVGAGLIGWSIPSFFLRSRIKRRTKVLNDQLCDAIVLISNSLKAGYSFFQSIDIVAKEMTGPIAEEFTLLQKEINLGSSTEKALDNLVGRVSSDDLGLVVTAVLIQKQVGGNLSEVLDNISSTIRDRLRIKGEVRTITAQGRMSGLIISLLPVALGVILYLIAPDHIGLLFTDPLGIAILVFSVFMELIGIYFISRIVKVEM